MTSTAETSAIGAEILKAAIELARRARSVEALAEGLPLDGRDAYLALVAEWRARYAELSGSIRAEKRRRKGPEAGWAQSRRESLRVEARRMMAVRAASRLRASASRAKAAEAA